MKARKFLLTFGTMLGCGTAAMATDNSTSASATNEAEASNGNGAPISTPARDYAGFTPPGETLIQNRNEIRPGPNRSFGTRQSRAAARSIRHNQVPPPANPAATQK
jgi:hypothetical protein